MSHTPPFLPLENNKVVERVHPHNSHPAAESRALTITPGFQVSLMLTDMAKQGEAPSCLHGINPLELHSWFTSAGLGNRICGFLSKE